MASGNWLEWAKLAYGAASTGYAAYKNSKANKDIAEYFAREREAERQHELERIKRMREGPLAKLSPFLMQQALGLYGSQMGNVGGGFDYQNMQRLMGVRNEDLQGMPAFNGWFPGQGGAGAQAPATNRQGNGRRPSEQ